MKKLHYFAPLAASFALAAMVACSSGRHCVTGVERSRVLVDSRYDNITNKGVLAAANYLDQRRTRVDSLMSPVMGVADCDMASRRPESPLSNLLADVLVWSSKEFGETPDFAVYNMGGIRASLSKGNVTCGDILDVAPFENKICFLTLSGSDVMELFGQIAMVGGEGISHGVRLEIEPGKRLVSAKVGGKVVDPNASYRIATLDYLAQGNDHLDAFKKKTNVVSPTDEKNNVRFLIENYFKAFAAQGKSVHSEVEGRINVVK